MEAPGQYSLSTSSCCIWPMAGKEAMRWHTTVHYYTARLCLCVCFLAQCRQPDHGAGTTHNHRTTQLRQYMQPKYLAQPRACARTDARVQPHCANPWYPTHHKRHHEPPDEHPVEHSVAYFAAGARSGAPPALDRRKTLRTVQPALQATHWPTYSSHTVFAAPLEGTLPHDCQQPI